MAQWRAADHPGRRAVADEVREVRPAALDETPGQRTGHEPRALPVEVAAQLVEVKTWGVAGAHRCPPEAE
jgi:hypothetical protein